MHRGCLRKSLDNSIFIVTLDEETASTCSYSLPRANKVITGPTVHLAKIIAQNWGNLRVEAKVISIDKTTGYIGLNQTTPIYNLDVNG